MPLRVCLDARLIGGFSGGIEQNIVGLANGLSNLTDGDEEYLFLTHANADEWMRPYVGGPCRILPGPLSPFSPSGWKKRVKSAVPGLARLWEKLRSIRQYYRLKVPVSDGTVEKAGADIMHFTWQGAFLTELPSIYHPWDLQHLHLPHFFSRWEWRTREILYRAFCQRARMVAVASSWGKRDVVLHYGLPDERVQVVPIAALTACPSPTAEDIAAVRQQYKLPERFIYYPAQTWPHKNHIGLLEALAVLRDRHGLRVPLVCSGCLNSFYPKIEKRVRRLRLTDQVSFLGFVGPLTRQYCLYRLCRCVVFPTMFEGWGLPLTEAFQVGVPVACSNATLLPDLAGDAALLFDPSKPDQIAAAIARLWTDDALCRQLVERGRRRVAQFTWDRTARLFRAHYRRIAGKPLTDEDRALLQAPPLV